MSCLPNPDLSVLTLYKNRSVLVERYGFSSSRFSPCPVSGTGWLEIEFPFDEQEAKVRVFLKNDTQRIQKWGKSHKLGEIELAHWILAEVKKDREERRFWHSSSLYADRNFETYYREENPLRLVMKVWGDAFGMMRGLAYFRNVEQPMFSDQEVNHVCKYLKQPFSAAISRDRVEPLRKKDFPDFGTAGLHDSGGKRL